MNTPSIERADSASHRASEGGSGLNGTGSKLDRSFDHVLLENHALHSRVAELIKQLARAETVAREVEERRAIVAQEMYRPSCAWKFWTNLTLRQA